MVITQQRQRPTNLQVVLRIGWSFPLLFLVGSSLHGQETREETAYLQSFSGYGMRSFMGNRWGSVQLNAVNPTDEDRELLVTLFNAKDQVDQYCKRVWVPANSRLTTWLPFFASTGELSMPLSLIHI